ANRGHRDLRSWCTGHLKVVTIGLDRRAVREGDTINVLYTTIVDLGDLGWLPIATEHLITFHQVPPPTQTLGGRHLGVQRVTLPSPSRKNDGGSECPLLPRLNDGFDRLELVGARLQDHASSPSS